MLISVAIVIRMVMLDAILLGYAENCRSSKVAESCCPVGCKIQHCMGCDTRIGRPYCLVPILEDEVSIVLQNETRINSINQGRPYYLFFRSNCVSAASVAMKPEAATFGNAKRIGMCRIPLTS